MPRTTPILDARVMVSLTPEDLERFKAASHREHRSMGGQLRKLVIDWLNDRDSNIAVVNGQFLDTNKTAA